MSDETMNESVDPAGQGEAGSGEKTSEFYEKELDRARKDAAKYRERARSAADETETKLRDEFANRETDLKSQIEDLTGKYEDAIARVSEYELNESRLRLAVEHGVPSEHVESFTKRLVGETPEELAEDAKSLAGLFGGPKVEEDHSQGSGSVPSLNSPTLLTLFENKLGNRR